MIDKSLFISELIEAGRKGPILPMSSYFSRRSRKEYSGNQNIGIEYQPHYCALTFFIAASISDFLSPASLAAFLAFLMRVSNSSIDGGDIFLRITTSLSPNTTN